MFQIMGHPFVFRKTKSNGQQYYLLITYQSFSQAERKIYHHRKRNHKKVRKKVSKTNLHWKPKSSAIWSHFMSWKRHVVSSSVHSTFIISPAMHSSSKAINDYCKKYGVQAPNIIGMANVFNYYLNDFQITDKMKVLKSKKTIPSFLFWFISRPGLKNEAIFQELVLDCFVGCNKLISFMRTLHKLKWMQIVFVSNRWFDLLYLTISRVCSSLTSKIISVYSIHAYWRIQNFRSDQKAVEEAIDDTMHYSFYSTSERTPDAAQTERIRTNCIQSSSETEKVTSSVCTVNGSNMEWPYTSSVINVAEEFSQMRDCSNYRGEKCVMITTY